MGSWIAAIGAVVAATAGMVGMGAHHTPPYHHHHVPSGYSTPTPTASPTPGTGSGNNGGQPPASPNPSAERTIVPLQTMPAGAVTLSVDSQTGRVTAQLNLYGLAPGTQHRVALYDDQGQNLALTFPDVTVNGEGDLQQTVLSNQQAQGGLPGDLSFQIDLLPTQMSGSGASQVIAVANGQTSSGQQGQVTLQFASTISKSGTALLSYDPSTQKLTVSLQVSGLVPGSQHAAHIHTGSCQDQGPVLIMLPDLVANGQGDASEQTTVSESSPPPAAGWYVNVHDGTMNDILQNGQPGPLFQPLVCGNVRPGPSHF